MLLLTAYTHSLKSKNYIRMNTCSRKLISDIEMCDVCRSIQPSFGIFITSTLANSREQQKQSYYTKPFVFRKQHKNLQSTTHYTCYHFGLGQLKLGCKHRDDTKFIFKMPLVLVQKQIKYNRNIKNSILMYIYLAFSIHFRIIQR